MTDSPRYSALDILRGLSITGMILVNNPGAWNTAFPMLRHEPWSGTTAADMVFPFFVFIMGAAMAFSFAKRDSRLTFSSLRKIILRGVLIFAVGLALNAFPFYPLKPNPELSFWENFSAHYENWRIFGVFQRLALCYVLGSLLILLLRKSSLIFGGIVALIALHWYLLVHLGDANAAPYYEAKGVFSLAGQGTGKIDEMLVGIKHIYTGYGVPFDPEGIVGTLTSAASVMLGFLAGRIIQQSESKPMSVVRLYSMGVISLIAAYMLSSYLPVVKALWTGSYVLETGGWAMICLAFLIYLADIKGKDKYFMPLKAMGMNPLTAYILADLLAKAAMSIFKWVSPDGKEWSLNQWYYWEVCVDAIGESDKYSSLLYSSSFALVILIPCLILYKFRIVIRL